MVAGNRILVMVFPLLLVFSACSFNYSDGTGTGPAIPDMILTDVSASRYEDAKLSMILSANILEMYDSDSVWAGEKVSFVQYSSDTEGEVEAEGSAGYLLVNRDEEVYSLGENISFHLLTDDLFFKANDLQWTKKAHRLSGSANGEVSIEESDGSVIRGTGFVADTLARVYAFSDPVTGQLVNEEP
jgi:hypothetical protein